MDTQTIQTDRNESIMNQHKNGLLNSVNCSEYRVLERIQVTVVDHIIATRFQTIPASLYSLHLGQKTASFIVVGGMGTFCKPRIYLTKQASTFVVSPLLRKETGECNRSSQFPAQRMLPSSTLQRTVKCRLHTYHIRPRQQSK